jgi:hypothetical protein
MKNFLAFKDLAYAAAKAGKTDVATNPNSLADGAIGVYIEKPNGSGFDLVLSASPVSIFKDVKRFVIARGTSDKATTTASILRTGIKNFSPSAYSAGAKEVKEISALGGGAGVTAGQIAELNIMDNSATNQVAWESTTVTYVTRAAAESNQVIAEGLKADIDARPDLFITATVSGTGAAAKLVLTHKVDGKIFSVKGQGISQYAVSTRTTKGKIALNDYKATRNLEVELEGYAGRTDYIQARNQPENALVQVASGVNYDIYNLLFQEEWLRRGVEATAHTTLKAVLAFPTGAKTVGNSKEVFEIIMGKVTDATAEAEPAEDAV